MGGGVVPWQLGWRPWGRCSPFGPELAHQSLLAGRPAPHPSSVSPGLDNPERLHLLTAPVSESALLGRPSQLSDGVSRLHAAPLISFCPLQGIPQPASSTLTYLLGEQSPQLSQGHRMQQVPQLLRGVGHPHTFYPNNALLGLCTAKQASGPLFTAGRVPMASTVPGTIS